MHFAEQIKKTRGQIGLGQRGGSGGTNSTGRGSWPFPIPTRSPLVVATKTTYAPEQTRTVRFSIARISKRLKLSPGLPMICCVQKNTRYSCPEHHLSRLAPALPAVVHAYCGLEDDMEPGGAHRCTLGGKMSCCRGVLHTVRWSGGSPAATRFSNSL